MAGEYDMHVGLVGNLGVFSRSFSIECGICYVWLQAEINFLGQFHHPHLVKLFGFCIEEDQRLLVYEFMQRGSLENHLFRSGCLFNPIDLVLV